MVKENSFYFLEKNCNFKQKYIKNVKQYNVYTNEFGLRYSGKKFNENKKNIFYFGDSFTYGLGLEYDKTYVGILEKKINQYNHLNFGLQGYSPLVYKYQLYKMIDKNIYPKKIILALDYTDLFENSDRWIKPANNKFPPSIRNITPTNIEKKNFKENNFKATRVLAQLVNGFFRNIKLNIKNAFENDFKNDVGKTEIGRFLYSNDGTYLNKKIKIKSLEKRAEEMKKTLKEIFLIAESINADFYILIYPWPDTLAYGQKNFNWENYVSNFCISNCKKLINTFPKFFDYKRKNISWYKDLYIKNDLHFTQFGNLLIADEILKEIE